MEKDEVEEEKEDEEVEEEKVQGMVEERSRKRGGCRVKSDSYMTGFLP